MNENLLYILGNNELSKIDNLKLEYKYLPLFMLDNYIDIELIINKIIIILVKSPYRIYGYIKVIGILLNKLDKKISNTGIYQNDEVYEILLNKYSLGTGINDLYFICFNNINIFKNKITVKEYNDYMIRDKLYNKIKVSHKMIENRIVKISNKNFLEDIINYDNNLSDKETENNKEVINNLNIFKYHMCIPIYIKFCEDVNYKIEDNKIRKKDIAYHMTNCNSCEIINNNIKKLELKNKIKILYCDNTKIMDNIENCYCTVTNYMISDEENNELIGKYDYDNNKICIIKNLNRDSKYFNIYFLIHNN
jgi:hypothetical protein